METSRSVSSVLVARSMPDQGGLKIILKIIFYSNLQQNMCGGGNNHLA
jgi:hypothetical protein